MSALRPLWVVAGLLLAGCTEPGATLLVRVLDEGAATPARVEVIDARGEAWVSQDALPLTLECLSAPPPAWLEPAVTTRSLDNPYTATTQFYLAGAGRLELPPGDYALRVFKGNEYRVAAAEISLAAGEQKHLDVVMERWADPAQQGWWGSDDHVHITRVRANQNPWLSAWMAAEGLRVANLLQMGTADQFGVTPQYAFGDAGVYHGGESSLVAGQEHPRTHFLGHTITLGAEAAIDLRPSYIDYRGFWRESARLGGVSGFAHLGQGPAQDGLAISAPTGGVHFIEVLQWEYPQYRVWYELLDLGFRIAPSAGTDFPCITSTPGRERVYLGAGGNPAREALVDAMRSGRTFVTNGPLLELRADDAGIGDELDLAEPGRVEVRGSVRFDPERDDVRALELVVGGEVVEEVLLTRAPGRIELAASLPVAATTWLALRAGGVKLDEAPFVPLEIPPPAQAAIDQFGSGWDFSGRDELLIGLEHRASAAHTAAIFVTVGGARPAPAPELVASWIERLDALAARLEGERIAEIPILDWMPYSDGVSEAHLRGQRAALLESIDDARRFYGSLAPEAVP